MEKKFFSYKEASVWKWSFFSVKEVLLWENISIMRRKFFRKKNSIMRSSTMEQVLLWEGNSTMEKHFHWEKEDLLRQKNFFMK